MELNYSQIAFLVGIMVLAGGLGGIASFYSSEVSEGEKNPLARRIVLGIAAAIAVPLFLNMISSSILSEAMSTSDYLVFSGFCLVAGFSSRAFLTSVSQRILERVESVENRQTSLEEDVDPIIERETEPESSISEEMKLLDLDDEDIQVLRALNNPRYLRRYIGGIKSETNFEVTRVAYILQHLKELGLVHQRMGKRKDLFWLTMEGRNYLRSLENENNA